MKRLSISLFLAAVVFYASYTGAYAFTVLLSGQVGATPTNGYVLQTNGTNSTWVATSSLGISGGGSSTGLATTSPWTINQVAIVLDNGHVTSIATSSLGLLTTNVAEGSNLYFTNARALTQFIANLAATTSVSSIATLPSLSLPYSQLTGTPSIPAIGGTSGQLEYNAGGSFGGVSSSSVSVSTGLSNTGTLGALVGGSTAVIKLADTLVTPGSYTNSNITVDQQGRITSASNGASGSGGAIGTSTALVNTNVDFSTSANTIANDSSFTFDSTAKRLGFTFASTTGISASYASSTSAFFGNLSIGALAGTLNANAGTVYASATTSVTNGTGISFAGTAGALIGGSSLTITNSSALSSLTAGFPYSFDGNHTLTWIGLGTSSPGITSGQPIYATGANTIASVASSTFLTSIGGQASGSYITALTGDVTAAGPGSVAATLATVNGNVGTFTYPSVTVNGKGLITAISNGSAPTTYTAAWPITLAGSAFGFNGLATTSTWTPGQLATVINGNTVASVATSTGTCTSASGVSCTSFSFVGAGGSTIALSAIPNSSLSNSTISGVALGSTLNALTATNGSLTFSGSYDGSAARTVGLNVGNANTWTALQTFANATTTLLSANYASSTQAFFGTLTIPSLGTAAGAFLAVDANGKVIATSTPGGSGTVTSVALTVPSFLSIAGSPITTNGTLAITLSGTALPIANGGTGSTTAPVSQLLYGGASAYQSVATTSFAAANSTLTVTGTLGALVGGANSTIGLNLSNANTWSALQTFANASSTTFGVSGELNIPHNTNAHPGGVAGDVFTQTTTASSSFEFSDGSNWFSLYPTFDKPAVYASSSLAYDGAYGASATTSYTIWNPSQAVSVTQVYCKTDVSGSTAYYEVGNGTASTTVQCTFAGAAKVLTTAFTLRQGVVEALGTQSGNPNHINVTPTFQYTSY